MFNDIINGAVKSKTIRWAGVFGALWSGLLGLDWAGIQLPDFLQQTPWAVYAFGIAQSIMMVIKRTQTTEALADKK